MIATENNKLIAEFMGNRNYLYNNDKSSMYFILINTVGEELIVNYDNDWGLLMEVVEKIESLGYRTLTENECFMITKNKLSSFDVRSKDDYNTIFSDNYEINHYGGSKKENVYNACIDFIKWHNENGEKNN